MHATQDLTRDREARLERETVYWDQVYASHDTRDQNLAWMEYVERTTFNARFFRDLVEPLQDRRILSIGGGVDRLGVDLAARGHRVVCVDISSEASARTAELARRAGVADRLSVQSTGCERMTFAPASFDLVLCKRALHHMEIGLVVPILRDLLDEGGIFLAEEPICLHPVVRWVHGRFPFYGDAPHTPDERELNASDLDLIRNTFETTRVFYFDLLARESLAYWLQRHRWDRLLYGLSKADFYLANRLFRSLRRLCNYAMIYATK